MSMQFSSALQDTVTTNLVSALNGELGATANIHFFDGVQPAACSDADDGTELVLCQMDPTPFAAASGNVFSANTIAPGTVIADGDLLYFRMKDAGLDVIAQGSCGIAAENIVFDDGDVTIGDTVTVTAFDVTVLLVGS